MKLLCHMGYIQVRSIPSPWTQPYEEAGEFFKICESHTNAETAETARTMGDEGFQELALAELLPDFG